MHAMKQLHMHAPLSRLYFLALTTRRPPKDLFTPVGQTDKCNLQQVKGLANTKPVWNTYTPESQLIRVSAMALFRYCAQFGHWGLTEKAWLSNLLYPGDLVRESGDGGSISFVWPV